MPMYVYQVVTDDGSEGEVFEIFQSMSDAPLTKHPRTGQPVKRMITAPNLPATYTDAATKTKLSDKNLERMGFTKYQRAGDGQYEKRTGKGPRTISAD
ncbi:MAG: zinc ribbon domain-containing protein [Phycisphaerales bacterium]|nr:zinc ribbon domain-containing protein [Phycisphaerales bacterium]